jgi:hypothetical protein
MKSQLQRGIKIESEHKSTYDKLDKYVRKHHKLPTQKQFFTLIAKDHLKEFRNKKYYNNLYIMEKYLKVRK